MNNMLAMSQSNFSLMATGGTFTSPYMPVQAYDPGHQIYNPGRSFQPTLGHGLIMNPVPWPSMVPTLNCMQSFFGFGRVRPTPVVNNLYAPLFNNNMFIGGIVGKSQG